MMPVTEDRSKAMVPVLGQPLVEHALEPIVSCGLRSVVVVVGPDDEAIRHHFIADTTPGIDVTIAVQRERRGMAHALGCAAPLLHGDFVLTACDSLIPPEHVEEMVRVHEEGSGVLSLMDVKPELVSRSAAVDLVGGEVRAIVEKPAPGEAPSSTVSLPHYILPYAILEFLPRLAPSPRGEIELQSGIQRLIDGGTRVVGVRTPRRVQVSSPEDLRVLNLEMLRSDPTRNRVLTDRVGAGSCFEPPLRVDREVTVGRGCSIGPNVYLERGCVIGDGVEVRDSVVLRGVHVSDGSVVESEILC